MKHLAVAILVLISSATFAQNFNAYKDHIAKDRMLVMFNKDVPVERRDEIIHASTIITSFAHLPNPQLTICNTADVEGAKKYFAGFSEVKFISFFVTAGGHYAGVLNDFFVKLQDKNFEPLFRQKLEQLGLHDFAVDKYIPNLYLVTNSGNALRNTADLCEDFSKQGWCKYATPNLLLNPIVTSNDPFYAREWNIHNTGSNLQGHGTPGADMRVDSAWDITSGDPNIKVAILDSGVDTLHNDLKDNMLPGHDAIGDSTDGYPTPNYAEDGHGTCCAGIVAAVKDNSLGVTGVAPSCKLIPIRTFYYFGGSSPTPFSTSAKFAAAIGWAWSEGHADIMSNSWGLPDTVLAFFAGGTVPVDEAIEQAYLHGRGGLGTPMFFSSGNDNDGRGPIWPARLDQTIAVGATDMCDQRKHPGDCSGENWGGDYGPKLDFSAPGVKITTTDMRGNKGFATNSDYYTLFNGTSAACPNAAGVGALVLSVRPDLNVEDVRNAIARTCDKVGGYRYDSAFYNGSWSNDLGYGRVNAYNAVLYAMSYASVRENGTPIQIKIFPNPSNGVLNVQINDADKGIARVFNMAGQQLFETEIKKGINRIDLSSISPGVYLIKIETPTGNITSKITLLR